MLGRTRPCPRVYLTRGTFCVPRQRLNIWTRVGYVEHPEGRRLGWTTGGLKAPLCRPFLLIVLASVVPGLVMINYYLVW
jgi:hypothetical protein